MKNGTQTVLAGQLKGKNCILRKKYHSEDKEIALMFDDLKRRTAIFKLAMWKNNRLISGDHFKEFTNETQEHIQSICDLYRQQDS